MAKKHFTDPAGRDRALSYLDNRSILDGTYYLKEIQEPEHFLADENIYELKVSKGKITGIRGLKKDETGVMLPELVTAKSQSPSVLFAVNNARSGIKGKKTVLWLDNGKVQKEAPLGGILFDLYEADGTTLLREGSEESGEGISREDGSFAFYGVDYGSYVVKERSGGPLSGQYKISGDQWTVEVKDNQVVSTGRKNGESGLSPILFQNLHKKGMVRINKVDAASLSPLEHVKFDVYPKDKPQEKIYSLVYDANGFYTLPTPSVFSDQQTNQWGEPYVTWEKSGGAFYPALIAGEYEVVEEKPQPGYENDLDEQGNLNRHLFSIKDGKTAVITNNSTSEDLSALFTNTKADWRIAVQKRVEVVGERCFDDSGADIEQGKEGWRFKIFYEDTGSGGLYENERISDFAVVKKGEVTASPSQAGQNWIEVETGADGMIELERVLPGTYRVKEMEKEGEDRYRVAEEKSYVLGVNQKNQLTLNGRPGYTADVANLLRRYTVSGIKQDEKTKAGLPGAVIGLFPADAKAFTEAELFYGRKAISGASGGLTFENIPYGTYLITELKAPEGYILNQNTVYHVEVSGDEAEIIRTGDSGDGQKDIMIRNAPTPSEEEGDDEDSGQTPPDESEPDESEPEESKPEESEPEESEPDETKTDTSGSSDGSHGGGHGSSSGGPAKSPVHVAGPEVQIGQGPGVTQPGVDASAESRRAELPSDWKNMPKLSAAGDGSMVEISVPEGADVLVEIWDHNQNVVYHGRTGKDGKVRAELSGQDYILAVLDEEGVPLAFYQILLTEGNSEGLPKTGDNRGIPMGMIAMLMLGALLPEMVFYKKTKEEEEEEKAIFRKKQHFIKKRLFKRR